MGEVKIQLQDSKEKKKHKNKRKKYLSCINACKKETKELIVGRKF